MNIRKQRGMSFLGYVLVLSLVLFFVYLAMRITPMYLEYYSVATALNGLAKERGSAQLSPYDIKVKIMNRLYLSYSDNNVGEEHIRILRRDGVQVRIAYEVRKPLLGNLDVVGSFDKMVRLSN